MCWKNSIYRPVGPFYSASSELMGVVLFLGCKVSRHSAGVNRHSEKTLNNQA